MRNLLFLITVFTFSLSLATAQTTLRPGAQSTPAKTVVPSVSPRPNNNATAKNNTSKGVQNKPTTTASKKSADSRENTTPAKTTARSTGAKAPATIPAVTTRNNNSNAKTVSVKQQPVAPLAVIKWMTIEEALEKSKTEKRKIYIDVYTDWCGWCKHMDSTTFKDQSVVNYINEKYYAVKFNAEQGSDINYKGKNYKFTKQQGGRGHHELAALWLNNRLSYPTSVVLNEDQDLIQPIPGFQDANKMDAILHYFGTDNHKKTPWEKYERNYSKDKK